MTQFTRIAIAAGVAAALLLPSSTDAQTLYTCGQATVREVKKVDYEYQVRVELADAVYVGRSAGDAPWNFDPTQLAIGQPIAACASGEQMVLDRLDGTDYRAKIVAVTRSGSGARTPDASLSAPEGSHRRPSTARASRRTPCAPARHR